MTRHNWFVNRKFLTPRVFVLFVHDSYVSFPWCSVYIYRRPSKWVMGRARRLEQTCIAADSTELLGTPAGVWPIRVDMFDAHVPR